MKKLKSSLLLLLGASLSANALDLAKLNVAGDARVRSESKVNADYNDRASDRIDFTTSRFRMNFDMKANDQWNVFFQPQFVKYWGQLLYDGSSATANAEKQSSGALYNSRLDVHQAFINYTPMESLGLQIGRQELGYGDELLVGAVGWHNIGRTFDALRAHMNFGGYGKLDAFCAKVVDMNVTARSDGDYNFHGLYYMNSFGDFVKNFDLYALQKEDHRNTVEDEVMSFGARVKSPIHEFDYRIEYTTQLDKTTAPGTKKKDGEYQGDIEAGYTLGFWNTRFAGEYFISSENFDQLFPTAHKWLGFADQFARRNMTGYVAHLSTMPMDKLKLWVDYHMFKRKHDGYGAYNFGGTSLGTTGKNKAVASEVDFSASYQLTDGLNLAGLYAVVMPDKYLKDQNASQKDNTVYTYIEIQAKF